jgi:hypothetical protein
MSNFMLGHSTHFLIERARVYGSMRMGRGRGGGDEGGCHGRFITAAAKIDKAHASMHACAHTLDT